MPPDYLTGIGLIAQAIADLLVAKKFDLAFTDFMKGLGMFGVHSSITAAMQAPPGDVAPVFQAPPSDSPQPQ